MSQAISTPESIAITYCHEQLNIALRGSYEAEAILSHMLGCLGNEPEHALLKALVLRLHAINSVGMSALSGKSFDSTEHLRSLLDGRKQAL